MKRTLPERAAAAFNLPADLLAGLPKIEVTGLRETLIENHRGILRFGAEEVVVGGGTVNLVLRGDGFILRAMNARELRLEGLLFGIDIQY
ncbi:MAG: sporulation protein [Oscillospiraceae bacterium]|nr:sporulation protein [Oscillospiraceae bacterium]